jgi:hypothetical protein
VADGTRTRDHRDHNPGLYQLSYRHRALTSYPREPTDLNLSGPDPLQGLSPGASAGSAGGRATASQATRKRNEPSPQAAHLRRGSTDNSDLATCQRRKMPERGPAGENRRCSPAIIKRVAGIEPA